MDDLEDGDLEDAVSRTMGERLLEVEVDTLESPDLIRLGRFLGYNLSKFAGESFAYTPFPPSKKELTAASLPFPIPISNRWLVCV